MQQRSRLCQLLWFIIDYVKCHDSQCFLQNCLRENTREIVNCRRYWHSELSEREHPRRLSTAEDSDSDWHCDTDSDSHTEWPEREHPGDYPILKTLTVIVSFFSEWSKLRALTPWRLSNTEDIDNQWVIVSFTSFRVAWDWEKTPWRLSNTEDIEGHCLFQNGLREITLEIIQYWRHWQSLSLSEWPEREHPGSTVVGIWGQGAARWERREGLGVWRIIDRQRHFLPRWQQHRTGREDTLCIAGQTTSTTMTQGDPLSSNTTTPSTTPESVTTTTGRQCMRHFESHPSFCFSNLLFDMVFPCNFISQRIFHIAQQLLIIKDWTVQLHTSIPTCRIDYRKCS